MFALLSCQKIHECCRLENFQHNNNNIKGEEVLESLCNWQRNIKYIKYKKIHKSFLF